MARTPDHRRLGWEDTRILRLENEAIMGHTLKLVTVDARERPLAGDELRRHVAARLDRAPIARRKVVFPPLRVSAPMWVDDPDFDIRRHIREHRVDAGAGPEELQALLGRLMSERLDHTRPLWRMDLISLPDDTSAVAFFIHHCMADGITALRLGEELLWDSDPAALDSEPAPWRCPPPPSSRALLREGLRDRAADAARSIADAAASARHPAEWGAALSTLARLPGALVRELRPGDAGALDRHIGPNRQLAFVERPFEFVHELAHRASARLDTHVTINDTVLAAIAGGLREWRGGRASERHLRVQVPVSLHARHEQPDELGNHDSFLFVDLPTTEPDPLRRLELISAETQERKARHDAEELYSFFHALGRLGPIGQRVATLASGPREFSLSISNVPGPSGPLYVKGRPVTALHSSSEPAERHALRVSVISGAGAIAFTLCSDPEAISDLHQLAGGVGSALDELGSLLN